jgi:hypothetical protein
MDVTTASGESCNPDKIILNPKHIAEALLQVYT